MKTNWLPGWLLGIGRAKPFRGVDYITEEEFYELERQQREPVEPTESIKRGADLMRRLYPHP